MRLDDVVKIRMTVSTDSAVVPRVSAIALCGEPLISSRSSASGKPNRSMIPIASATANLIRGASESEIRYSPNFSVKLPGFRARIWRSISVRPLPVADFGHVVPVLPNVLGVFRAHRMHLLLDVGERRAELGHTVDHVHH